MPKRIFPKQWGNFPITLFAGGNPLAQSYNTITAKCMKLTIIGFLTI